MTRSLLVFCFFSLATTFGSANDAFTVYVPDQQNQQLVQLTVRTTVNGISIQESNSLKLPFAPSSTTLNAKRSQLILTSGDQAAAEAATVQIMSDGQLKLSGTSKLKHPTGYTSVDRNGRFFLTAHYATGMVAVYQIKESGSVDDEVCSVTTPNTEAHCILTTRDNHFTYVPCVKNNNALFQFAFDEQTGQLTPLDPFDAKPPAMFGPRHVAYHPTLPIAYFSNEQQLGVSVYEIGTNGQLAAIQHTITMPRRSPFVQGERDLHASDLVLSTDGKRLFVAVRDFEGDEDSVFAFRIEDDGKLNQIARTKVGDIPWKLGISPDGSILLVSETGDRNFSAYRIEPDGRLSSRALWKRKIGVRDMVIAKPMSSEND